MGRSFAAASSRYISTTSAPVGTSPYSISAWFRSSSFVLGAIAGLGSSTVADSVYVETTAGANLVLEINSGASQESVTGSTTLTTNAWHHVCLVATSDSARVLYLDGASEAVHVTSKPVTVNRTQIGNLISNNTLGDYFTGDLAEVAMWDVALTTDEVASLALHLSASVIRPASLKLYAPMLGTYSPELELAGQLTLTLTNAPGAATDHPTILYPPSPRVARHPSGSAVSATGTIAVTATAVGSAQVLAQASGSRPTTATAVGGATVAAIAQGSMQTTATITGSAQVTAANGAISPDVPPGALADNQMEIGADGLIVGPGTAFQWVAAGPQWFSAAPVRTTDQDRQAANGIIPGLDYLGKHTATIQVSILGDSQSDLADKIDAWKAACTVNTSGLVQLRSQFLGRPRVRFGRFRRGGDVDTSAAVKSNTAVGSAQFETFDALTYGDREWTVTTGPRQPALGIPFPWTFPINFGAATSTGAVAVINSGNAPAPWSATMVGPLRNMVLGHAETGRYLLLAANGGISLDTGQTLTVDSAEHSVLIGGANWATRLAFESRWWDLAPGVNTFTLSAASGTGTVAIQWRDAWWS